MMATWYSGGGGDVGILANVLLGKLNRYQPSGSFLEEPTLIESEVIMASVANDNNCDKSKTISASDNQNNHDQKNDQPP